MDESLRVVLVSNRGPVSFTEIHGSFQTQRGAGGLAGALDWAARELGDRAQWIAAATSDDDREAHKQGATEDLPEELGYRVHLLDIDPDLYEQYYDWVSNRMLWFANHCLWNELDIDDFGARELDAWKDAYEPVNQTFAAAAAELAEEGALVLFQDYHLATAPGHLRRASPDQVILHFTHSSFCGPNGLGRLPKPIPKHVIEGMLGADLIGFHVAPWVEGFMECCELIGLTVDRAAGAVRHEGRCTWVRAYPIPIDADDLRERASGEDAKAWAKRFIEETDGPLVVRADRIEPSKNIVRGFEAFGQLLDRREDLSGHARFVACLYPSRQTLEEYKQYAKRVSDVVAEVNGRHPGAIDLFMENDFDRTMGALEVYDVLLVNSIMDGMNLVSKEGAAVNDNSGVLVLSKGAGSFTELGEDSVEIADPLSVSETASAIESAIDMPPQERSRRAAGLRKRTESTLPQDWIGAQLDDLAAIKAGKEPLTPPA